MADPKQINQAITALPAAPAEGSGFRARAMAFFAGLIQMATQLEIFRGQLNEVAIEVNGVADGLAAAETAAVTATQKAGTATAAASTAIDQAGIATSAAAAAVAGANDAATFRAGAAAARDDAVAIAAGLAQATADVAGIVKLATSADALAGTDTVKAVTPKALADKIAAQITGMCPTQITNAGFGVWSNGTLESTVSSVNLIINGEFETDTNGWTASQSILARDISIIKNGSGSLKITNSGVVTGAAYQALTTVIGNVYKVVGYCYIATAVSSQIRAGTTPVGYDLGYTVDFAAGSFVRHELFFEAVGTTTYITLITSNAVSSGINYWDSITLYDMGANIVSGGLLDGSVDGWGTSTTAPTVTPATGLGGAGTGVRLVRNAGGGVNFICQGVNTTPGKLYKLSIFAKQDVGTTNDQFFSLGIGSSAQTWGDTTAISFNATAAFSMYSVLFEATQATSYVQVLVNSNAGYGPAIDSITLTEVTVGCVDYNTKALDLWTKDVTARCWRETIGTKEGSLYALRVYNGQVYWSDGSRSTKPEFYYRYAGRATARGMWVKCSTASKARIGITDSVGTTWSSYHSGGGDYEWLEVTRTPGAGITSFSVVVDSGTAAEAVFSQPQLQFGSSIGQGNYVPRVGEYIPFEREIGSSVASGAARSATALTTLKITQDSLGKIPAGADCVDIWAYSYDTAAPYYSLAMYNHNGEQISAAVNPAPNVGAYVFTKAALGLSGSIKFSNNASGTNTFVAKILYKGVQL